MYMNAPAATTPMPTAPTVMMPPRFGEVVVDVVDHS